jgi:hypothetical protein
LWAVENFLVQSSVFDQQPTTLHPHLFQTVRFGLNLVAAGGVVLLFSRVWLIVILAADFVLSAIVLPYAHYFHHSLSMETTIDMAGAGLRVSAFALRVVPPSLWLGLAGLLAVKVCWAVKITPQPAPWRRGAAGVCLLAGVVCVLALQRTSFRFSSLRTHAGTRAVYAYGYLTTWAAELFYGPDMKDIGRELRALQSVSPDRLTGTEKPWPVGGKVAIVQMESIGWSVLNYRVEGRLVAPYLSDLARSSRCFKIQAYHAVGSADMDYAVLTDGTPSTRIISYDIPGLTYSNALPAFLQKSGYHTVALHGNDGGFFNRRNNFERMGFDEIWFKEDFKDPAVKRSGWGVRDEELFKLSSKKMREDSRPQFHFIITLDSHGPFNLIRDDEKQIFPHSRVLEENYFNSVRVLDGLLRDYVESLPAGTLVILYGDHTSGVEYGDFHSAREGAAEFVPCIAHVCGAAAATPIPASLTSSPPPPHDLRVLDVINFMRHQIQAAANSSGGTQTDAAGTAAPATGSQ